MYTFKTTDKEIVNDFNRRNPKGHIFQTSYWADLKKEWEAKYLAGYKDNGEIVLTAVILLRKIPYINKYIGYIPRGFTCDYTNRELIEEFTAYLKTYSKENRISFITLDPDIHLRENEVEVGEEYRNMFLNLGYISNISKNFENIQPSFVFRLKFDMTKEREERKKETFNNFTSKTRYNIKVACDRGLSVEVYDKNNITEEIIDKFYDIMIITGKRDNFIIRPRQYFKDMICRLGPHCRLYMVRYNYEIDYKRLQMKLKSQMENRERLMKKKSDIEETLNREGEAAENLKLRKKLDDIEKRLDDAERQIENFKEKIDSISEYKDKKDMYLSGAIYLNYAGKGWYLYGASHNILRDTMPNFLMQWSMIQDSIDLNCYMYDFRGVSGDLSPENPLYGLYKFKKGFNGDFVEFIGELDLVSDRLVHKMFRFVLPRFRRIRGKLRNNNRESIRVAPKFF
ncbi:peptidoglycan bridge formation glycyltransferase FemA/FemB family protein [Fonticella tunisiensis]|uniref:Peptidoglycan pentaglycine glycine transferase (The first glycine) n=1 Tax=Fonticella tunisiensis TaxID=1096341 RepID=A0A4R7KVR4_9CLOT|nr:peptidoglycan bridge formation glycyltransferase FemA/FemB family protein [Fonticella tunisiensis]TDT63621.1 peptidoglycan pentaglycine glycine transferase (the first glycine) [Fonticella tunisiensis]